MPYSPRLHQQSHEGIGRRCCAGFQRIASLISRSSGIGTHPSSAECAEAARIAWGGERYKLARSVMREQGRSKTGKASLPHVKLSPMGAPGPTGERQEHLDAIVAFAGAGQRRRLFRGLDILTVKWATGDLPEECRFLLNTQLMFLGKEKDPTSKQFDDDEMDPLAGGSGRSHDRRPKDSVMPDETFVPGLSEECRYTADVREEGERPDLEAVR